MDREALSSEVQDLVGRCMSLETTARKLGETALVAHLEQARHSLVAAAQRLKPLGGRNFPGSCGPKSKP